MAASSTLAGLGVAIFSCGAAMDYVPRRYIQVATAEVIGERERRYAVRYYRVAAWIGTIVSGACVLAALMLPSPWLIAVAIAIQGGICALGWQRAWRHLAGRSSGAGMPSAPQADDSGPFWLFPITILMFMRIPGFFLAFAAGYGLLLRKTFAEGFAALYGSSDLSGALLLGIVGITMESVLDVVAMGTRGRLDQAPRTPKVEHPLFVPVAAGCLLSVLASFAVACMSVGKPGSLEIEHTVSLVLRLAATVLLAAGWAISSAEKLSEFGHTINARHWAAHLTYVGAGDKPGDGPTISGLLGKLPNLTKPIGWLYLLAELLMIGSGVLVAMVGASQA
jgi:hypothetical protein